MKILYLCPDAGVPVLGRKGASVHVRQLIAAFDRVGHNVVLAAQLLNKSPWEKPESVAATLLHLKPGSSASASVAALKEFCEALGAQSSLSGELRRILYNKELENELKRRFDSDPPDFIYERASLYAIAGTSLARAFDVPLVVELNAPLAAEQSAYRATGLGELAIRAEQWTLSQADTVVAVSSSLREHAVALGVAAERVHVIPNGVDPSLFHPASPDPALRKRWGIGESPVIGFLGGLRPWHGVEVLPELLERLIKRHLNLKLVIAGDGQLRSALERDFSERGLRDGVIITGTIPHEEVPAVIRQFDVALAPYPKLDHSFYFSPLKLFEYMACGIPVVAANLGQIAEVVSDSETALLYPAGELDALAAACDRLLLNPKLCHALGQAASKLIHDRFTWDQNATRVTELVTKLKATRRLGSERPA